MRKDLFVTALGIGGGQLVVLAFTPLLARAYSPSDFGVYAAIVALATIVASVSSLRYETAITVVSTKDVSAVSRLAIVLPLFICPLLVAGVVIGTQFLPRGFATMPRGMELIVGGVALLQGGVSVAYALCTRGGYFGMASVLRIVQPAAFVVGALLLIDNLPYALIFSWAMALGLAAYVFKGVPLFSATAGTLTVARKNWRYPVLYAPVSLLDNLTLAMPVLVIVSVFGGEPAGNYSQVQRLLGAPMLLIGMAVGQVFLKHAGDRLRGAMPLGTIFNKIFGILCLGSTGLLLVICVCGDWIVALMLGKGWRADTGYLVLVVLPVLFRTAVSPLTSVFLLCEKIRLVAMWQMSYFLVMAAIALVAAQGAAFDDYLKVLVFGEFFMYSAYFWLAFAVVRRFDDSLVYRGGNLGVDENG